jgi:CRISPR-associated endonuclease/helicase Cas3
MEIQEYFPEGAGAVLLAHTARKGTDGDPETLVDHSNLVIEFAKKLSEGNGLSAAIDRIVAQLRVKEEPLCHTARQMIIKWFMQAIYLHDIGKINPAYQKKKMQNQKLEKLLMPGDSNHALLSALLYLEIHLQELDEVVFSEDYKRNRSVCHFMKHVLYVFAYVISRHHTYLGDIEEMDGQETSFEKQLRMLQEAIGKRPSYVHYYRHKERLLQRDAANAVVTVNDVVGKVCKKRNNRFPNKHSPFPFYVLTKLLYSTMVASDFYATNDFDTGRKMQFRYFSKENELQPLLDAFQNTDIYRGVQAFRINPESNKINPINKLRSSLFDETEKQLLLNLDQYLYYLEAPTGSGKTYMSINLGLKLLNSGLGMNKLIYVFPFNALIEQTKQTLDTIFPVKVQYQSRMAVVNSVTPIVTKKELKAELDRVMGSGDGEPDIDYKTELLQRQMLQYPVTLTSHVNFFNYLFGIGRESNLAFTHLCNSVIVLDEIQSYKNGIWKEIIHFLRNFAELLNMKILIMSATLPKLDKLVENEAVQTCSLVANRDVYFQNPLFRDRVHLHFYLLEKKRLDEDDLLAEVCKVWEERKGKNKSTRLFVEFITKAAARSFYQRLRAMNWSVPLFELTGDDSNLLRKRVLYQLGKDETGKFYEKNAIVVATQVIEAGVDIDMDIGFKDISMLDSEEQFLGRINRSCLRDDCHAYFFNMVRTTTIYRDDLRTEKDLQSSVTYQQMLVEKDFSGFYQLVMERINEDRSKANKDHWSYFISDVQQLQFKEVEKKMRLITDKHYTLFLNYKLTYITEEGKEEQLDGQQVWQEFKELLLDKKLEYAERIVRLSQTKEKMSYFTYNYGIQDNFKLNTPQFYTEVIGSLFYVPDGERFMELDENTGTKKFNSQMYRAEEDSLLL